MFKHSHISLTSMGLAAALCAAAFASAAADLPDTQQAAGGSFITGGIGLDESTAMKAAMKDWPIAMQFAQKDGQHADYVADVKVAVSDVRGNTAIEAVTQGPFLLANVLPGTYRVEATLDNKTLHQVVAVRKDRPVRLTFLWPAQEAASR